MADKIVKDAVKPNGESIDIEISGGVIENIIPAGTGDWESYDSSNRFDASGKLVSPPLVEPHTHINGALTIGPNGKDKNPEGTLLEAISSSREMRRHNTDKAQIKQRAHRLANWFVSYGVTRVRSHLGVYANSDDPFTYVDAMVEVKEEVSDKLDIQLVGMPDRGFAHDDELYDLFEEMLDRGVDVVGGIPHGEDTREAGVDHIEAALDLAEKKERLVDMHIDETDDPDTRFTEVLAHKAKQYSMGSDVTASHVTSLHSQPDAYADKLCRLLAESDINVVTNPIVNSVLQGRYDGYPRRRGHTRVDELSAAGVTVGVGQDNICDLFNPYGDGDPLKNLNLFAHFAHMNRLDDVKYLWQMFTQNNALIFGLADDEYGLEEGNEGSLVVYDATTPLEAIRTIAARNLVLKDGETLATTNTRSRLVSEDRPVEYSTALSGGE